jgi:hypothetical protein
VTIKTLGQRMLRIVLPALAIGSSMVFTPTAIRAAGNDDVLARLEALEKDNAAIQKENAALRETKALRQQRDTQRSVSATAQPLAGLVPSAPASCEKQADAMTREGPG